jgi:RNA polymerase sigma-70 factor (ECF subfamily)
MGQRLSRAKNKIREAGIPFRVPERADLRERLDAVLAAIYAAFAEGWSDPDGTEARRRNLSEEGIWLGRLVVSLLPDAPEALGLLALMLFAEARRNARRSAMGDYVPLAEQDAGAWDVRLIDEAETLLRRASQMGEIGRYQLEAAVQSAQVVRRLTGSADWAAIERLYDALLTLTGSPVVAINRAVAIAQTRGPAAGLAALDALSDDARLAEYQPYWAARAQLLARMGDTQAADRAFERAIGLESDPAVRRFLQVRRAGIHGPQ